MSSTDQNKHEYESERAVLFVTPDGDRRFVALDSACDNLECRALHLSLVEIEADDRPIEGRSPIVMSVDVDTWQNMPIGDRPPAEQRLVEAFVADFTDETRTFLRGRFDMGKEQIRRIATHRLPPDDVLDGVLVSYVDVTSDALGTSSGERAYDLSITHADTTYVIDDLYCPNPECDCKLVDLVFAALRKGPEGTTLGGSFRAVWPLSGTPQVDQVSGCSKSDARAVLSAWRKSDPHLADTIRRRYEQMKGIGKRSLAAAALRPAEGQALSRSLPNPERKVGRNEPCPCGSGRKYKRCCGKTG